MKWLYQSSKGHLELETRPEIDEVAAWLFDADGAVVAEGDEEWAWGDVSGMLHTEIGLPQLEAESIAARFLEAASAAGHDQQGAAEELGTFGKVVVTAIFGLFLLILAAGVWTLVGWIF